VAQVFVQASRAFWLGTTDAAGLCWAPLTEGERIEYVRVTAERYRTFLVPGPPEPDPEWIRCLCLEPGRTILLRLEPDGEPIPAARPGRAGPGGGTCCGSSPTERRSAPPA